MFCCVSFSGMNYLLFFIHLYNSIREDIYSYTDKKENHHFSSTINQGLVGADPGFPKGKWPSLKERAPTYCLTKLSRTLHENEEY